MPENKFRTAVVVISALPTSTLSLVVELIVKLSDPKWVTALERFLHDESLQPKEEKKGDSDSNEMTRSTREWREENGVIRGLSVTSDGTTGEEWVAIFEAANIKLSRNAKDVLLSDAFKPTTGVTYKIEVLKSMLFKDSKRITSNIRVKAEDLGLTSLHAEAACLMRRKYSDDELEEMGLYRIFIMHEPIDDSVGDPRLLFMNRGDDDSWLSAASGRPGRRWLRSNGFACAVSQAST